MKDGLNKVMQMPRNSLPNDYLCLLGFAYESSVLLISVKDCEKIMGSDHEKTILQKYDLQQRGEPEEKVWYRLHYGRKGD